MLFLKSLTHKFVAVGVLLLVFLTISVYSIFDFTRHIRAEANRINLASQLRFRSFEMGWLSQKIVETDIEVMAPRVRSFYINKLKNEIAVFDGITREIKQGSMERGLDPLTYTEILPVLNTLIEEWDKRQRPVLVKITELDKDAPEKQARELLRGYDAGIHAFASGVDNIIRYLEKDYGKEVEEFNVFMFSFLGVFCIAGLLTGYYAQFFIVRPIQRLRDASKEVEKGHFGVSVDSRTSDEVGGLSKAFNTMTATLAQHVAETEKRTTDLLALSMASNEITGITNTDLLYQTICRSLLKIYDLKLIWLGLVGEGSFEVEPAACEGDRCEYLSGITVTWDDAPTGMGPVGMAIKTKSPLRVIFADEDSSFTPWVEKAKSSGFESVLALPLISAGNDVIGAIVLYSDRQGYFTEEAVELLQVFANQAAAVIGNARMVERLERTVSERTRELEDARLIAESANMAKTNFLTSMSHELRTPLNVIIGFSEALVSGVYGEVKGDHLEYIDHILKGGIQLLSLVNSILELTTIDAGTMVLRYTECSIPDLVDRSAGMFREKARKHRIDLRVEMEESLFTTVIDENKVKFVLVTLLANALKTTPDGSAVCLSVRKGSAARLTEGRYADATGKRLFSYGLKTKDFLEITIEDAGPVISPQEREDFFTPFPRVKSPRAEAGEELRIELALCRRFIELHGGEIWIESLPAGGSAATEGIRGCEGNTGNRFIVVLPRRPSDDKIQPVENG